MNACVYFMVGLYSQSCMTRVFSRLFRLIFKSTNRYSVFSYNLMMYTNAPLRRRLFLELHYYLRIPKASALKIRFFLDFYLSKTISFENKMAKKGNLSCKMYIFMAFMTFSQAQIRYGYDVSLDNSLKKLTMPFQLI